jgi:anti-anti-sigma factor
MSEPHYHHLTRRLEQGAWVVTITEPYLGRDTLIEELRRDLLAAVPPAEPHPVVLDFRQVRSFSSAAFRPLLSLRKQLAETGNPLVLCNLSPAVAQTFAATRLLSSNRAATASFVVRPNVAAALAHLHSALVGA